MEQQIEALTDAERSWLSSQLQGARLFVEAYAPEHREQPLGLAAVDRAFAAWLAEGVTAADQINSAINCVGVIFGQALVDELELEWVIATDEHGSELAVYGPPGRGDVLVYPANFVAKRWERRETFFLERSFDQMAEHVRAIQPTGETGPRRPWWKIW